MDGKAYDILILGAGPAGISAALTARARGRRTALLANPPETSSLFRAKRVENYPGLSGQSGEAVLRAMLEGLKAQEIPVIPGRAAAVMPMSGRFMVSAGQEVYTAGAVILATGAAQPEPYPGERELLGRGVSYCATCDGMFYRGKTVAVVGLAADAAAEADFLRSIGCTVEFFGRNRAKSLAIRGGERAEALVADGAEYPVDGVFILRDTVAAPAMLAGLAMDGGHIAADGDMKTNIPGVFAAGDCAGRPYQIAKAVGQGNIAALSADAYIKENET